MLCNLPSPCADQFVFCGLLPQVTGKLSRRVDS